MCSLLFLSIISVSIGTALSTCVVVEYECRSGGADYTQANRDDCSRFVYCSFGRASYWQCRRGFVFDFCRQPATESYDVFAAPTTAPPTTPRTPIIPPFLPGILPGAPYPPVPMSPYNPYLYGPGVGVSTGGLGFNMNLNYNPLLGWGVNSNLALETPWATMLAPLLGLPPLYPLDPYNPGIGMPLPGMPGLPFPPLFRQFAPSRRIRQFAPTRRMTARGLRAVEVNACVPVDAWNDSSTTPITSTKIDETFP